MTSLSSYPTMLPAPRTLAWRDAKPARSHVAWVLLATGAACCLPFAAAIATEESDATPGNLIRDLTAVQSMRVEVDALWRAYPSTQDGGVPQDGVPTFGTMIFRDQGLAWRIENDIDATRMSSHSSMDSSFDGNMIVRTHMRNERSASITHLGEHPFPQTQSRHPFFYLAMWTDPDPVYAYYPTTRTDIRAIPDTVLDVANAGWIPSTFDGAEVDQLTITAGSNGLTYVIVTPPDQHDQPICIDQIRPDGSLSSRVQFSDWEIPVWGEDSLVTPRPLPFTVRLSVFTPAGEPSCDLTLTVVSCSIDVPIPEEEMVTPFDEADHLIDEDLKVRVW